MSLVVIDNWPTVRTIRTVLTCLCAPIRGTDTLSQWGDKSAGFHACTIPVLRILCYCSPRPCCVHAQQQQADGPTKTSSRGTLGDCYNKHRVPSTHSFDFPCRGAILLPPRREGPSNSEPPPNKRPPTTDEAHPPRQSPRGPAAGERPAIVGGRRLVGIEDSAHGRCYGAAGRWEQRGGTA